MEIPTTLRERLQHTVRNGTLRGLGVWLLRLELARPSGAV